MAVCVIISFRAAQLGDSFPEGVDTVEAIQTICKTLMQEGFDHISTSYTVTKYMEERLAAVFEPDTVLPANLVHYHCLLKRTGGKNKWTLKRETGESRVTPYIPLLLWACKAKMTADVCFDGQEIVRDHVGLAEGSTGLPFFLNENWREISVLEFLNGTMPSKVPKLKAQTSQPLVEIIVERNENLRWREAQDQPYTIC